MYVIGMDGMGVGRTCMLQAWMGGEGYGIGVDGRDNT